MMFRVSFSFDQLCLRSFTSSKLGVPCRQASEKMPHFRCRKQHQQPLQCQSVQEEISEAIGYFRMNGDDGSIPEEWAKRTNELKKPIERRTPVPISGQLYNFDDVM